ncbi:MAG: hypothetical protein ACI4LB_07475 [Candidatus Fimenecus sp.]
MKMGKAYRIFTIVFCGVYLIYTLFLMLSRVLSIFSNTAETIYMSLVAPLTTDEAIARYLLSGVTLFPVAVSVIYFLCIGELREAISKAELLLFLIPAALALMSIILPIFLPPLLLFTPILYFCLVYRHVAELKAKSHTNA